MKRHLPVFLIFIAFILGCASTETIESTKISPTVIFQDYSISSNRNQTTVSATFRVDGAWGTTVDLDTPSKIELNGSEMKELAPSFLKGTNYQYSSDHFEPVHQFVYTDATGKTYRNEVSFTPLEIKENSFVLDRSTTNKILLSRRVGEDETVSVNLVSATNPPRNMETNANSANVDFNAMPTYSINRQIDLDKTRTALVFNANDLKKIVSGKTSLSIEVQKEASTKEATPKGGRIVFNYTSAGIIGQVLN